VPVVFAAQPGHGGQACVAAGADPLAVPGSDLLTYDQLTAACKAAVQDARRSRRDAEPFTAREVTAALGGVFPNVDMSSRALGGGRVRVPVASANELGIGRSGAGHASAWRPGNSAGAPHARGSPGVVPPG
jgi:hypothetical protein